MIQKIDICVIISVKDLTSTSSCPDTLSWGSLEEVVGDSIAPVLY